MNNYEFVLEKFKEKIKEYNDQEKEMKIKLNHSYHVADLSKKLAKRMERSEEEIYLASVIGLLHDIGRFKQYKIGGSYNDLKTNIDHAELAINYLFKENHIQDFEISSKYYKMIEKAIKNHNRLTIEKDLEEKELFFSKLIRDVDKIDNFRVSATCFDWKFTGEITKEVEKSFKNHELIDRKKIKTESDNLLSILAFIYDINFKEALELLNDTDNLELFLSVVEIQKGKEEEWDNIKKEIQNFLKERIEENAR